MEFGSLGQAYRASWPACLRLCMISSFVLSLCGLILVPYRDEVLDTLAGFFVPVDWLASFHMANNALFHQLGGVLLFQTVAIACFSAISLLFFPFRDRISLQVEKQLTGQAVNGPGLGRELWLEAGLVLIAFNFYSVSYLLAYFIGQPLFAYIDELAFFLLLIFFILDLLSPTYFRRNMNCLYVFRALRRQPLALLLFGIIFCSAIFAMELFLGELVSSRESDLVLAVALVLIIVLNCIVCVFALPMGTWLALNCIMQQNIDHKPRQGLPRHRVFYYCQLVICLLLLLFYGAVIGVLSSKVPLKSADYDIQWTTMSYRQGTDHEPPSLHFDMQIYNRHQSLGLQVESAMLLVNLDGRYLGEVGLNIPYVAPNSAIRVPVELKLKLDFSELAAIATQELFSFISGKAPSWREKIQARLTLYLPLGLQLPIYITEGYRHEFQQQ